VVQVAEKFRVIITDLNFATIEPERRVLSRIGASVTKYSCKDENDVIRVGKDADALLVQYAPITERVINRLERVRAIGRYGIGVDNIDLHAATQRGIQVVNVIYAIYDVADHTVAMLLAIGRKIPFIYEATKAMRWDWKEFQPIMRLKGSKAGIIGFGRVGMEVAKRLTGFGMILLGYDPFVSERVFKDVGVEKAELEKLLSESDYITLNSALSKENVHMIDEPQLRMMKKTAFVINTSRGQLINESALIKALRGGWIAGAALDVLEKEPPTAENPLIRMENVIMSPHLAWYSESSVLEIQTMCAEDVARILVGEKPTNLVNREVLSKLARKA
jgi:D-3-phosphoglycerate dehydrogenase